MVGWFLKMSLLNGFTYNLKGLWMGIKTPKLLVLGLVRFVAVIIVTILCVGLLFLYHEQILNLIWTRPDSRWILWLWHLFSWLLSLNCELNYLWEKQVLMP